jgi:methionyl aminopeptidase
MRRAGKLVAETLRLVEKNIKPGVTTAKLDKIAEDYIISRGAIPAFKGYHGYPASTCISIDDEVVHGIPGNRELMEGQIVSVDLGAVVDGYYGDSAATFPVGEISPIKRKLLEVTKRSLEVGLSAVRIGAKLGEVSHAIQKTAESAGFSVVRDLVGHGIGRAMHEEPQIPNFGSVTDGPILQKGMALAIEPMVNIGSHEVRTKADGWTIVTVDGSPSAHFEHTVAVGDNGAEILTI